MARGTFGSPTFFVGEEMWFGKDRLRDVEEAIIYLSRAHAGEVKTRSVEGEGDRVGTLHSRAPCYP